MKELKKERLKHSNSRSWLEHNLLNKFIWHLLNLHLSVEDICHIIICYEDKMDVLFFKHLFYLPLIESKLFF